MLVQGIRDYEEDGQMINPFRWLIDALTLPIPTDGMQYCPHCGGTGYDRLWTPCPYCRTTGYVKKEQRV